ncbi:NmrA family NAD(P)-binding protein [Streptomyces sp. NPDC057136]|uniref:NmrA family NAD(P)-binding protein n=1 Tax=Streptomyces sp. NPDC057136 TaxID=3346029 RepID=UPI0036421849
MTTLVTGATGNTGRHVVAELVRRGEHVRALTRNPAAAAGRLPAEVELVAGTHTAPEDLDAVFDGVSRLHITVTAGLAEAGPELVRRAVGAGVRRITVVWGGGVGPVEKAVADSGVEWTRLEPQEFMSNTLGWIESIRAEGIVREPYDFPSALVHEADIGAVAAVALLDDGHAGRAYNLTGPELLTSSERIAILARATGRDIAFVPITHEQAIDRLTATGVSRADAEYVVGWYATSDAPSRTVVDTVEQVTGRPPRTFAQWVAEHTERFQCQLRHPSPRGEVTRRPEVLRAARLRRTVRPIARSGRRGRPRPQLSRCTRPRPVRTRLGIALCVLRWDGLPGGSRRRSHGHCP